MVPTSFSNLWFAFWADLHNSGWLWQVSTIAFCLVAGWSIGHFLRLRLREHETRLGVIRLDVESFANVVSPLAALVLIMSAKPFLAHWHRVNLLRVAIPLVASFAIIRFVFYVLRRIFARGRQASALLLAFEKLFAGVVWIGVALYITGMWPDLVEALEDISFTVGHYRVSAWTALQASVAVFLTLVMALWASAMLEERLMRVQSMHSSLRAVLARMGRALLILIAVLVSLSFVGIDLTVLSVFGGALGVGIGLGLQKIASSYISGFVILFERSLALGDMVAVDKYYGKVTQINTRYTILQGLDGVESVVPNDLFLAGAIQNYSLTDRVLRLSTQVTVDYQTDIDNLLPLLELTTASVMRVLKEPAPQAALVKFGTEGLELEIGFWIADPENGRLSVLSKVNRAIWYLLKKQQVKIPYTQREVYGMDPSLKQHNRPLDGIV